MKKQILIILLIAVVMLIGMTGCNSIELDGFSIGVVYLNTDITTGNSLNTPYGQFADEQTSKIEGFMPTAALNFKFK